MASTKRYKGSRGLTKSAFSLIETLVAISISLIVGAVLAESFIGGWRAQLSQEIYGELQRQARFTLDEMTRQVWNATTVTTTISIGGTTYDSDVDTVVLRLPPLDASDTIITGDDYIVFDKNGSLTQRLINPDAGSTRTELTTPLTINRDTGVLLFRYFNAAGSELVPGLHDLTAARKIEMSVKSTRVNAGRTYERQIDATVILRNKGI